MRQLSSAHCRDLVKSLFGSVSFLHCLIYKVHLRHEMAEYYITTSVYACQYFISTFLKENFHTAHTPHTPTHTSISDAGCQERFRNILRVFPEIYQFPGKRVKTSGALRDFLSLYVPARSISALSPTGYSV